MKSRDNAESGSLTPEIKRKAKITNATTKKYEYGYKDEGVILQRFAIDTNSILNLIGTPLSKDKLHVIEEKIFESALLQLAHSPVVLVDIFKRNPNPKQDQVIIKDSKTGYPETHIICLWKNPLNKIFVIDPSNSDFSSFVVKAIGNNMELYLHPQKKFYAPTLVSAVGRNELDKRDCIDIAVKIAFQIIESTIVGDEEKVTKGKINSLSNQSAVNNSLEGADGTILRELQSSDPHKRQDVVKLLEDNKDSTKIILVNTSTGLTELNLRKDEAGFPEKLKSIEHLKKIPINKLDELSAIQSEIDNVNARLIKIGLPFHKAEIKRTVSPELDKFSKALVELARENNVEEITTLLSQFTKHEQLKDILAGVDDYGQTALFCAAGLGNAPIVSTLIARIEDPNIIAKAASGNNNYTALHVAVHANNLEVVELLLTRIPGLAGAQDIYGQTALAWAAGQGYTEIAGMLIEAMLPQDILKVKTDTGHTPLHLAVHSGNKEIVKQLLDKKIPELVGVQDVHGQTALCWVAGQGQGFIEIAGMLIEAMLPQDILKVKTDTGHTPLHLAVHCNNLEVVEHLLKKVPELAEVQDKWGQTALIWAVRSGENYTKVAGLIEAIKAENIEKPAAGNDNYTLEESKEQQSTTNAMELIGVNESDTNDLITS